MSSLLKKVLLNSLQGASFAEKNVGSSVLSREICRTQFHHYWDTSAVSLGPFCLNNLNFAETLLNVSY